MHEYKITQWVSVEVDETKFTPDFMKAFAETFYDFQSIDDHRRHLAQLVARGVIGLRPDFIEGYGNPSDFGIRFKDGDCEVEAA